MTYQDPDPLRDPRLDPEVQASTASTAMWGWIAGVAVLVLLLVFLFGSGTETVQTTDINRSPANPMITAPAPAPPANTTATAPAQQPAETTGQGQSQQ
jgi:hypothetical protein